MGGGGEAGVGWGMIMLDSTGNKKKNLAAIL